MKAETSFGKITNRLLLGMGAQDRLLLWPHFSRCPLPVNTYLERTGLRPGNIYFIESGVVSSLEVGDSRDPIEVGVVGREGMIGAGAIANLIPQRDAFVQIEGEALSIDVKDFQESVRSSPVLRVYMSRYIQAQMVQISLAASAAVRASVQQRLARKLLMYRDRTDTDEIALTHASMSLMLGVRRATVTNAVHNLEANGFIWARRGLIIFRDRVAMEAYCGRFYGVAETRYAEIMHQAPLPAVLRSG
ncbi:Crp/Fnr family transcriptional regulator [Novosphingobium sp. AP12]|uniref:Crp/Fnr family transcriptional regulator n=1 Tax=Novosphingobium sp. AP12 TaxID=1144305 RepID=UPI000271F6CE|nr:Crp/Fnr family transcriptional regulator [Novosphingobium sp. AP12]EJL21213.1 cAMP-binding protein [Novosphingobium sp. AP12]